MIKICYFLIFDLILNLKFLFFLFLNISFFVVFHDFYCCFIF